ncbi:MAG: hypothetical protein NTY83_01435 [Candidatus Micrarchaeota archaeon]|nr:hypothetical protein [Candidatus Micrarchaeota archaeon]
MKTSPQTIPQASDSQKAQQNPSTARRAALFAIAFLSGCGAAPPVQTPYTETNGHAEMVIVDPRAGPQLPLRERLAPIIEGASQYRVYPEGDEGNFGSASGGWTFRIIESESSERAGLYFYDLFPHRSIMGAGDTEPVGKIAVTSSINPNFNVPLQPSDYTASVGSDVFIFAIPSMVIFRFFNPSTGMFEKRSADLSETEGTRVPAGATIFVAYKPEDELIEVYYIADERAVVVQFSLLTTSTVARPVE